MSSMTNERIGAGGAGGTWLASHDDVQFKSHVEVANGLFGKAYKAHQSATFRVDEFTQVWFPKLYPNRDWDNEISDDGNVLTMRHVPGGKYGDVMESTPLRQYVVTFGHIQPTSGPKFYKFLGVFEAVPHLSDSTRWVHQRVSHTVYIDGGYRVAFTPLRTRPELDDQAAEAADTDPKLVATFRDQVESGNFTVDDMVGTTKSRGSAQAVFAKMVKDNYGWECAVTGIRTKAFLVASHIVPWSEDKTIRLDPSNGICLSTFVDRAFDAGYLAITVAGFTSVRWERVADDPILKAELARIDEVEVAKPASSPPDPAKLERRLVLGY